MANVALFITGINELKGGGGAERFFADFFDLYQEVKTKKHNLFYIIDKKSVNNLRSVGKLRSTNNILNYKIISNRFKNKLESIQLLWLIIKYKIKIIHLPLYNISYIPVLKFLNVLPAFWRPEVVVNISNCYIVPYISDKNNPNYSSTANTYLPLFNEINVAGYFSWYKNFEDFIVKSDFKKKPKQVYSITSRFSDTIKFYPQEKKNNIVFASRLDEQKHPEWFIEAIHILQIQHSDKVKDWKFIVCGNGPLRTKLMEATRHYKLENKIEFKLEGELQNVFNFSRIFVSCQDFENFPSLSMAEAMAAGNAVIARNVGQTNLFLKNNQNGLFINPDSAQGLVNTILKLIESDEELSRMGEYSVQLMKTVHTFNNFQIQIEKFWTNLI